MRLLVILGLMAAGFSVRLKKLKGEDFFAWSALDLAAALLLELGLLGARAG